MLDAKINKIVKDVFETNVNSLKITIHSGLKYQNDTKYSNVFTSQKNLNKNK